MAGTTRLELATSAVTVTTTYKTAGTAKRRVSRTRHRILWVGKRLRWCCSAGNVLTRQTFAFSRDAVSDAGWSDREEGKPGRLTGVPTLAGTFCVARNRLLSAIQFSKMNP